MDKIRLNNMRFHAHHGDLEFEKEVGQIFEVDVEVTLDLRKPCKSDNLEHTLDFNVIYSEVAAIIRERCFNLLEALAEAIAEAILDISPDSAIRVVVRKPKPPIPGIVDSTEVEINRSR